MSDDPVIGRLESIEVTQLSMVEQLREIQFRLARIENVIYGNGQTGLVTRVALLGWVVGLVAAFVVVVAQQAICKVIGL